jgi:cytochrome oxidase Cu insertion factor (SCO1/SenC/PrrC family)
MIEIRLCVRFFEKTAGMLRVAVALVMLSCGLVFQVNAQGQRQASGAKTSTPGPSGGLINIGQTQATIPDVKVFNEEGKQVRFYSDLVKNKVVLLNFFYTSCTFICEMQGENLRQLRDKLGARLGREVFLISVSMDPERDTPQKLKYWARAFGVKPGWTLVSSNNVAMSRMLKILTGENPGSKEMHSSAVFIGNDKTGVWLSTDGLSEPEMLLSLIDKLTHDMEARR